MRAAWRAVAARAITGLARILEWHSGAPSVFYGSDDTLIVRVYTSAAAPPYEYHSALAATLTHVLPDGRGLRAALALLPTPGGTPPPDAT